MDYTVYEILQARILEWVVMPFSRGSSQSRDRTQVSRVAVRFFAIWAARALTKNAVVGCHILLQGIFLNQGSSLWLLHGQVESLPLSHQEATLVIFLPASQHAFSVSLPLNYLQAEYYTPACWYARFPIFSRLLSIQSAKTRPGAGCGSDHELLIAKFRLKLKKVGKPLDHSGMT